MVSLLLLSIILFAIVGLLYVLFKIFSYYGKSDWDEYRSVRCSLCETQKKPQKTGVVRNLVELEMQCPVCGFISWDIPNKTNLSKRSSDIDHIS